MLLVTDGMLEQPDAFDKALDDTISAVVHIVRPLSVRSFGR